MTPSELKRKVEETGSLYFTRNNMKFSGDTMANYGVRKVTIFKTNQEVYELYRKRPVKHGLKRSAYFHAVTFERIQRGDQAS
jgi:hypothetical protein